MKGLNLKDHFGLYYPWIIVILIAIALGLLSYMIAPFLMGAFMTLIGGATFIAKLDALSHSVNERRWLHYGGSVLIAIFALGNAVAVMGTPIEDWQSFVFGFSLITGSLVADPKKQFGFNLIEIMMGFILGTLVTYVIF